MSHEIIRNLDPAGPLSQVLNATPQEKDEFVVNMTESERQFLAQFGQFCTSLSQKRLQLTNLKKDVLVSQALRSSEPLFLHVVTIGPNAQRIYDAPVDGHDLDSVLNCAMLLIAGRNVTLNDVTSANLFRNVDIQIAAPTTSQPAWFMFPSGKKFHMSDGFSASHLYVEDNLVLKVQ